MKIIPKNSILENEKEFVIYCETPGLHKEELEITLEDDILYLQGKKNLYEPEMGEAVYKEFHDELEYSHQFHLNHKVDKDSIKAQLEHGILKITFQKSLEHQPKKITIT
jgi:HSP20 family protein